MKFIWKALILTSSLLSMLSIVFSPFDWAIAQSLLQVQGALEDGDPVLDDGSSYDVYIFSGRAGQEVTINLSSQDFDTYLIVLDSNRNKVGENDDFSESDTNSRLTLTLPSDGSYSVIINAFDSTGRGRYSLTVSGVSQDGNIRSATTSSSSVNIDISVEGYINADGLVTINGLVWAAANWTFSKVLAIQRDSIDPTIVGLTVLDRHGLDDSPLLKDPFSAPRPGRAVLVSSWGSRDNLCAVELIIQVATTPESAPDASLIVPTRIEAFINGERITLDAAENSPGADRSFANSYTYTVWDSEREVYVEYPGVWVMARHLFQVNADQARMLSNAPAETIPIRVTLRNRSPITIPIGRGTVERWPSVFGYNPSCSP